MDASQVTLNGRYVEIAAPGKTAVVISLDGKPDRPVFVTFMYLDEPHPHRGLPMDHFVSRFAPAV